MGPEYNALLPEGEASLFSSLSFFFFYPAFLEGEAWLDEREIRRLLTERDGLRCGRATEQGDFEAAQGIRARLLAAGLTLVDAPRGHNWKSWADTQGRCGEREVDPPAVLAAGP